MSAEAINDGQFRRKTKIAAQYIYPVHSVERITILSIGPDMSEQAERSEQTVQTLIRLLQREAVRSETSSVVISISSASF